MTSHEVVIESAACDAAGSDVYLYVTPNLPEVVATPNELSGLQSSPNYERELAMARCTPNFTPAEVAHAVELTSGRRVLGVPRHIPRGLGNENWVVDTTEGRLVCKIGPSESAPKWRATAGGIELARAVGVPVPRLILFTEQCQVLGGRVLRLFEFIAGKQLIEIGGVQKVPTSFWVELGAAVRRLHGINLIGFSSRLDTSGPSFATWDGYLDYRIPQIQARVCKSQFPDAPTVATFWVAVQESASQLAPLIRPALTHRDLHPDNLLVSDEGGLAAILDFDQSEAWDPVADFFKLQWFIFADAPEVEAHFHAGYGLPTEVHPHFKERLNIVMAMELMNMIAGAEPYETAFVVQAAARLAQVACEMGWPRPI